LFVLIVGGTPGTGKTSISRILAQELGCTHESATSLLERVGGAIPDPTGRHTLLATADGIQRASRLLRNYLSGGQCVIIETVFPRDWYDELDDVVLGVILLRCNPLELLERLRSKKWPENKILENVLSEAFNIVAESLLDVWYDTIEIDTTAKPPARAAAETIDKLLEWRTGIAIDWLADNSIADKVVEWSSRLDRDKYRLGV